MPIRYGAINQLCPEFSALGIPQLLPFLYVRLLLLSTLRHQRDKARFNVFHFFCPAFLILNIRKEVRFQETEADMCEPPIKQVSSHQKHFALLSTPNI